MTFMLQLPPSWRIHNAFHVSLLRPYRNPNAVFTDRSGAPPPPTLVNGEPEYAVERLLSHRLRRRGHHKFVEFLVRWTGYDPSQDCWVYVHALSHAPTPLKHYLTDVGVEDFTEILGGQV